MYNTFQVFKSSHLHYTFYEFECEFNTLVRLFGDWFTYNTLVQYKNMCVNLSVGTTLTHENYIHVYVWINGYYIEQEIKFKNIGSELIYLLDDLVASKSATKKEV